MKTSENIDQIAAALAAAQAAMPPARFNKVNPHFKSSYADLAAIREATLPSLSKNGLAIVQATSINVDVLILFSRLIHKSGQWIEAEYPITLGTPQNMGSQLTYGRRYLWSALTGVAADEDDDAEVAEAEAVAPQRSEAELAKKKSARASKPIWEELVKEMEEQTSAHALRVWGTVNYARIHSMTESFVEHFREEYRRKEAQLIEPKTTGQEIDNELPAEEETT